MTTNKGLNKPLAGSTGWNTPLNDNADILDRALGDYALVSGTSGTISLSTTQVQSLCLKSDTSVFLTDVTFEIPSTVAGQWIVQNQSATSNYNLIVKNAASGTSVSIASGQTRLVYSDGTKVFFSNDQSVFALQTLQVGNGFTTSGASCSGTNATITFSGGYLIAVGQVISVTGVTPAGYNGVWTVTASSGGSVTFVVPSTLTTQTVAGSIYYGAILGSNLNLSGRGAVSGVATQSEATTGTNNTTLMTPLRTFESIGAGVTTALVQSKIAGGTLDAVGTYAFLGADVTPINLNLGTNVAGSSLKYASLRLEYYSGGTSAAQLNFNASSPTGTWKLMGETFTTARNNFTSLFLKVAG